MTDLGDITLLYQIDGWLSKIEAAKLAFLAADVEAPNVIVELGSYRGKSSCFLAHGSRAGNRRPVYCVDLWTLGGQWESSEARREGPPLHQDSPEHYWWFRRNTEPYRDLIVEVNRDSQRAGRDWKGGRTIGLLFVDADHTYAGCYGDLRAWTPHVAPGGFICCHDYENPDYPGVKQACDEFMRTLPVQSSTVHDSMLVVELCDT